MSQLSRSPLFEYACHNCLILCVFQGGAAAGGAGQSEQEKAALIMQVLQLTDEQINQLPPEQRHSIMVLKQQIAASRN